MIALTVATVFTLVFMVAEIVGGVLANSLAIITDAAHLVSLSSVPPHTQLSMDSAHFNVMYGTADGRGRHAPLAGRYGTGSPSTYQERVLWLLQVIFRAHPDGERLWSGLMVTDRCLTSNPFLDPQSRDLGSVGFCAHDLGVSGCACL
jgi:hypothetical protein